MTIAHQTRFWAGTALDFGAGHVTGANQALLTWTGTVGGEAYWQFGPTNDQYISAAIPPPGIQDPSVSYPGRLKPMSITGLTVFYAQQSTTSNTFSLEYGIQARLEGEVLSVSVPETFTITPDGQTKLLQTRTDTLATPVAVNPDEWVGLILGRLGSTDSSGEIFYFYGAVLEMVDA